VRNFLVLLILFLAASTLSAERVSIRKIKVIGNTYTDTRVILDYAKELSEGSSWDVPALSNTLRRVEERLYLSSYFYTVSAVMVPSLKDTNAVNVVIEVTEGFLLRFNGGNAYGSFGMADMFGQGKDWDVLAGYNAQWAEWFDHHTGLSWLYYEAGIGNRPDPDGIHQKIGGKFSFGVDLPCDLSAGITADAFRLFRQNYTPQLDALWLGATASLNQSSDFFSSPSGTVVNLTGGAFTGQELPRGSLEIKQYASAFDGALKFAFRAFAQIQPVWNGDPYFLLSAAGIDGVRQPETNNLTGNTIALASVEIRWAAVNFPILGFSSVTLEPALFADAGRAWNSVGSIRDFSGFVPGYGVTMRIFFEMPVLIPVRVEAGWGPESPIPQIFFSVESPF
jgi:hypothetical protein